MKRYTYEEWADEASRLFGPNPMGWKFECPSCGHVASIQDYKNAGAPPDAAAFSCVGRWSGHMDHDAFQEDGGPCNYAGGGLIQINPVIITFENGVERRAFDFAKEEC